jgi:hypothetical protein
VQVRALLDQLCLLQNASERNFFICAAGYCQSSYTVTGGQDTENLLDAEDKRETKMKTVFEQCDIHRATEIRKY